MNDDETVGRVLSRREAMRLLAVSSAAIAVGCKPGSEAARGVETASAGGTVASASGAALPACVVKPELEIGPYFLDKQMNRSDIRSEPGDSAIVMGAPLMLSFNVSSIANGACTPMANAMVDIWQCDAEGRYSGFKDSMVGFDTTGKQFLRGHQLTDASGIARFTTIYPGWYPGRAVHIHFKVRAPHAGGTYEFTSQLFFDDALTDQVHAKPPYAAKGQRDLRNDRDGIFRQSGGQLVIATTPTNVGYQGDFALGLDLSDANTGRPDGMGGRPQRRPS